LCNGGRVDETATTPRIDEYQHMLPLYRSLQTDALLRSGASKCWEICIKNSSLLLCPASSPPLSECSAREFPSIPRLDV
jgi:hypothetical protein